MPKKPVVVIMGGSGFLGKALIQGLLEESTPVKATEIRNFDLSGAAMNHDPRLKHIQGDVCKLEEVRKAVRGADLVIHSAAIVDWGTRSEEDVLAANGNGLKT